MTLLADYRRWSEAQWSYSGATVELGFVSTTGYSTLHFTHSHTDLQTVTLTNIYAVDIYTQHVRTDISVKSLTIALFSSLHVEGFNAPASRCKAALHPSPGRRAGRATEPVLREFATVLHVAAAPHTAQQLRAGRVRTTNGVRVAAVFRGLLHCQHIRTSCSQGLVTK